MFRLVAQLVARNDSLKGLLDATVELIRSVLRVDRCSIMLYNEGREELTVAAAWGLPEEILETRVSAGSGSVAGKVFQSGEATLGEAAHPDTSRYSTQTYICCPIMYEGRRLGVINVTNRQGRPRLDERDKELLAAVADVLAVSIDRAHISWALERANRQISTTLNHLPIGVVVLDEGARVITANAPARKLLGIKDAPMGSRLSEIGGPEVTKLLTSLADRAATSGTRIWTDWDSERDTASDAGTVESRIRITAEFIGLGIGMLFTVEDLTVSHAMAELKRIDQMKTQFISVISHELRTPITSLRGASTLLTSQYSHGLDDSQSSLLRIVASSAERLSTLVNMVIDISMIDNEQLALNPEPRCMVGMMSGVAKARERDLAQKGLTLRENYCTDCPPVLVDEVRMGQALAAVFDNAIKFATPRSEVTVRVWHDAERSIRVSIRNDGDVIAAEDRERAFERFSQLEDPLTRRQGGAGLGLYFARRVTMLHGGVLQFLDDSRGTCLEFVLPAMDASCEI